MAKAAKSAGKKPRLVGMNHVALEVGDIEEALAFYGAIFDFRLRSKSKSQAFIDMGDQFIALAKVAKPHKDDERHFSVVVDDRSRVKELAKLPAANCWRARSSISSIPGATASRWWNTPISSSPRQPMCCAAWASISPRTTRRWPNWPRKAWRPNSLPAIRRKRQRTSRD